MKVIQQCKVIISLYYDRVIHNIKIIMPGDKIEVTVNGEMHLV